MQYMQNYNVFVNSEIKYLYFLLLLFWWESIAIIILVGEYKLI